MSDQHAPNHNYHLVDPSHWPILTATSVFTLAMGAIMYMHFDTSWLLILGAILVIFCSYRDACKRGFVV